MTSDITKDQDQRVTTTLRTVLDAGGGDSGRATDDLIASTTATYAAPSGCCAKAGTVRTGSRCPTQPPQSPAATAKNWRCCRARISRPSACF